MLYAIYGWLMCVLACDTKTVPSKEVEPKYVSTLNTEIVSVSVPVRQNELQPLTSCPEQLPEQYREDTRSHSTVVVVFKSLYLLGFYSDGKIVQDDGKPICFPVAMGTKPWGSKIAMDNQSTPEGWYKTATKQDKGQTAFYRGFMINYPNADDVEMAFEKGVIGLSTKKSLLSSIKAGRTPSQSTEMGGEIMIHGMGSKTPVWTAGCVALNNDDIDVLFRRVRVGTTVLITPWTERYFDSGNGTMATGYVLEPEGEEAEIVIPYDESRIAWQPNVQFARLQFTSDSVTIDPIPTFSP